MHKFESISSYIAHNMTGSRVIAPWTVRDGTDTDIVILVTNFDQAIAELVALRYRETTGIGYDHDKIRTMRAWEDATEIKGHNLILVEDVEHYRRWCVATYVATTLGISNKVERVMLFHSILYGGTSYITPEQAQERIQNVSQRSSIPVRQRPSSIFRFRQGPVQADTADPFGTTESVSSNAFYP